MRIILSEENLKNIIINSLKLIILEENEIVHYPKFLKKIDKKVQKLNDELKAVSKYTEDDFCLLDEDEGSFAVENLRIEGIHVKWNEKRLDYRIGKIKVESFEEPIEYEIDGEWIENDELIDILNEISKSAKRSLKYFKTYDPSYDDNEEKHDEYMEKLNGSI